MEGEGGNHGDTLGRSRQYKEIHERVGMPKEAEGGGQTGRKRGKWNV